MGNGLTKVTKRIFKLLKRCPKNAFNKNSV